MRTLSSAHLSSGDLIADRRFEWARDREEKGDLEGAAELLEQALERVPAYASAWFTLGEIRERLGDLPGAVAAFRNARDADPKDRHGAAVNLMRLGAEPLGDMPPAYLRALFDHYAGDFDRALTEGLGYRAPALLRVAVERACRETGREARFESVLDLGCGTGLSGAAFRDLAGTITGIDISPGMLAQAKGKAIYDRLVAADIVEFLAGDDMRHDLILAADVFVYHADLAPLLSTLARRIAPDGLVAFSIERHDASGVVLRETLRYAHSPGVVRTALAAAGLMPIILDPASTRTEKGAAVPGLIAVARLDSGKIAR